MRDEENKIENDDIEAELDRKATLGASAMQLYSKKGQNNFGVLIKKMGRQLKEQKMVRNESA